MEKQTHTPGPRTYSDLVLGRPSYLSGNCCACHGFGLTVWRLGARAHICKACADKKGDAVLGSIARAERRAKSWIKKFGADSDRLIASVTGLHLDRVTELRAAIAKAEGR